MWSRGWSAGVALLLAVVALAAGPALARRLDALNQSYWELRYDYTRLRSQVARLDPEDSCSARTRGRPPAPAPP